MSTKIRTRPSKLPSPSESEIRTAIEDSAAQAKINDASPSLPELLSVGAQVKYNDDGTYRGRIEGKKAVQAAAEMMRKKHRLMAEDGLRRASRVREITIREPSGKKRVVHEPQVEATCKKLGAREVMRYKPTHVYRDGVWWKRCGKSWVMETSH